ncbi:dynein beta chain, ciliary-like [Tachypleus tridentatus]|uniref:dynein beta chain, ciliary-like n=1 Tax=Tachypleus tridentatus TaxID=6853 RepID=UPI003FCF3E84
MAEDLDSRIEFIYSYIQLSLKIKPDKWTKMLSVEENKQLIMDFLDKADKDTLIFTDCGSGQLIPLSDFPSILKTKAVYFIKHVNKAVPKENIHKTLMYGDLSTSPLEQLQVVIDEVFAPILCNPQNHRRWPKVIANDIVQHVLDFQSTMFRITGQIKGKTLLPLPPGIEHLDMYHVEEVSRLCVWGLVKHQKDNRETRDVAGRVNQSCAFNITYEMEGKPRVIIPFHPDGMHSLPKSECEVLETNLPKVRSSNEWSTCKPELQNESQSNKSFDEASILLEVFLG